MELEKRRERRKDSARNDSRRGRPRARSSVASFSHSSPRQYLLRPFPRIRYMRTHDRTCTRIQTHTHVHAHACTRTHNHEPLNDLTAKLLSVTMLFPHHRAPHNLEPPLHPPDHGQRSLLRVLGRCSPPLPTTLTTTTTVGRASVVATTSIVFLFFFLCFVVFFFSIPLLRSTFLFLVSPSHNITNRTILPSPSPFSSIRLTPSSSSTRDARFYLFFFHPSPFSPAKPFATPIAHAKSIYVERIFASLSAYQA